MSEPKQPLSICSETVQPPYANQFIEYVRKAERCGWCKRDKKRNGRGLCRHCDKIWGRIESLEKLKLRHKRTIDLELKVAHAEKEGCIESARVFGVNLDPLCGLRKRLAFESLTLSENGHAADRPAVPKKPLYANILAERRPAAHSHGQIMHFERCLRAGQF